MPPRGARFIGLINPRDADGKLKSDKAFSAEVMAVVEKFKTEHPDAFAEPRPPGDAGANPSVCTEEDPSPAGEPTAE